MKAHSGSSGISLLFLYPSRKIGVGGSRHAQPLYLREWRGTQSIGGGWSVGPIWRVREIRSLPGFHPRTFQPVANRYTDYAIPANHFTTCKFNIFFLIKHDII